LGLSIEAGSIGLLPVADGLPNVPKGNPNTAVLAGVQGIPAAYLAPKVNGLH